MDRGEPKRRGNAYICAPIERVENVRFLRGRGEYVDDIRSRRPKTYTQTDSCTAAKKTRYSITSSARPSNGSDTVIPSDFAALRLITKLYFVGRRTGRSAGFSPFKTLPV